METRYEFEDFVVIRDFQTGEVVTWFDGGFWSGCGPVPEDAPHAATLGIEPAEHRLAHELLHHLVGIHAFDEPWSPVIYRDAHGQPQPEPDPRHEEWLVTSLTYFCYGYGCDYGALLDLQNKYTVEPSDLADIFDWLMGAPPGYTVKVP